jgi:hypothetical protein
LVKDEWVADFVVELLRMAPIYKHPTFEAEREWRLIYQGRSFGAPNLPLKFRQVRSLVVPYVELPLTFGDDGFPIVEILVGPTPHPKELQYAVGEMTASVGLSVAVRQSNVPFRNW